MQLLPYPSLVPLLQAPPEQVTPLPQPISWGSISQEMPLFSTKMIPVRVARSSTRGLPPSGLGGSSGKSGSTISQSSSVTNSLAMFWTYPDSAVLKESLSTGHSADACASQQICDSAYPKNTPSSLCKIG